MSEACPVRLSATPAGTRFGVHVKPRASRSVVVGVREGQLDCAVAAPPVDGEANAELCSLIASVLGVKKREVEVVAGASGRSKVVEIKGAPIEVVASRLGEALAAPATRGRK